jgi:hypothetical protein
MCKQMAKTPKKPEQRRAINLSLAINRGSQFVENALNGQTDVGDGCSLYLAQGGLRTR